MEAQPKYMSTKFIILLFSFFIIGSSGCSKEKSSKEYFVEAQSDFDKGNLNVALIKIKNSLGQDEKNADARVLYAKILNKSGNGKAAEIQLNKALEFGKNKSEIKLPMARAFIFQGKHDEVISNIEVTFNDLGPYAADIHSVRGDAYFGLGNVDKAKYEYSQALKKNSRSVSGQLGLARLAAVSNRFDDALGYINAVLEVDSEHLDALVQKGYLFSAKKMNQEARELFLKVLEKDKNSYLTYLGLSALDREEGDLESAYVNLDLAHKVVPGSISVYYLKGLTNLKREKYVEAQEAVQEVFKVAPDYMPAILLNSLISYQKGAFDIARNGFEKYLGKFPNNVFARKALVRTHMEMNEATKASVALEPLLQAELVNSESLIMAAQVQMKLLDFSEATLYLEKAVQLQPDRADIQAKLAETKLILGDSRGAIEDLEAVSKQIVDASVVDLSLIANLLKNRAFNEAYDAVLNLENKVGESTATLNMKATASIGMGDIVSARKLLEKILGLDTDNYPAIAKLVKIDMRDGNFQSAKERLENNLKRNSSHLSSVEELSKISLKLGDNKEHLRWLDRAIAIKPESMFYRVRKISFYTKVGDNSEALSIAKSVVIDFPNSSEALGVLGMTQLELGMFSEAEQTLVEVVSKEPRSPKAHYLLALARISTDKFEKARESLNKSLLLNSTYKPALERFISLELEKNRVKEAIDITRRTIRDHPGYYLGYFLEANILVQQASYDEAIKRYRQALEKGGKVVALIPLHKALVLADRPKEAKEQLDAWLANNPLDDYSLRYAAEYYMRKGQSSVAIEYYLSLAKMLKGDQSVLNNLAILYQAEKDIGKALQTAEAALKLSPENPIILDTLGFILIDAGDLDRAAEMLAQATKAMPEAAQVRYHYALALFKLGDKSAARSQLDFLRLSGKNFEGVDDARVLYEKL